MMLKGLFLLTAAALSVAVQADGRPMHDQEPNPLTGCSRYMTETECQAHQRILTLLSEPREHAAYLAMHAQLIDDRRAACGVPGDKRSRNLVSLTAELR